MKRVDILDGDISKTLLILMFPILSCGIVQQLAAMMDGIIIGQTSGSLGISIIG
ncbi:MAG: MATE family efflux transporter, partial [Erysipelotrichia bacterium]|nr:MATE family efflux transporter [Erysipelotrichia bacterium]